MKKVFKEIIPQEGFTFKDLVMEILLILGEKLAKALNMLLVGLDDALCFNARGSGELRGWESIGKKERSLITLFGLEIRYKRRGYRRKGPDGYEYRYPLDELLGLRKEERFCPLVQQIAVALAAKMSYREAALFMEKFLLVPVSHQEIHRWVQEAGEARLAEQEKEREAFFEQGEVKEGKREAELVVIEADGVYIPLQRTGGAKRAEIKLGTMHEGWETESPSKKRFRLKGKECWGGVMEKEAFWERGACLYYTRYRKAGTLIINGDGAEWIEGVKEYLPEAEVYLDPFHRNRALREGLSFSPELLRKAYHCLDRGDLVGLEEVFTQAVSIASSREQKQRVKKLKEYFERGGNILDWRNGREEGLAGISILRGLGAAEPQNNHVIAARMKKKGMSWTVKGANNMVQLRCLAASGKLEGWLDAHQRARWPELKGGRLEEVRERVLKPLRGTDVGGWLRASIPLLATKAQASPLGEVLKVLSCNSSFVA